MKRINYLPGSVHSSLHSSIFLFDLTRVVEELVLNSLDAGATKVHVCVNVGACYVKVEDNGFGVTRDGLVLIGEKYATSKHQNLANMGDDIGSLGSRGEALSSLSDISLLEVITRARGRPNAYRKVVKGRKCLFLGIDEQRQDVGTTVIVRDLFYNQPVRRRSMQSSPKRFLHSVKKWLVRAALVHPQVSFNVVDLESENELLHTIPSSSPLPLVSNNFGSEISGCLHKVSYSNKKEWGLSGYLSGPADACSVKTLQCLYINCRFVCRGPIHKLINNLASSFSSFMDHQRNKPEFHDNKRQRTQGCPAYILNLRCPFSSYDMTFQSSKTVVEFQDWALVLSFVEQAVWDSWKQIPVHQFSEDSHKRSHSSCIGVGVDKGDVSAPDTPLSSEMTNGEYTSCYQNFLHQNPIAFSSELPQEHCDVYSSCRRSSRDLSEKTTEAKYRSETNCGCQTDYFSETKVFNSQGILDFTRDEIAFPECKAHAWMPEISCFTGSHLLSDHTVKLNENDDKLVLGRDFVSVDEENPESDSRLESPASYLYENKSQMLKFPFLLRCSKRPNVLGVDSFPADNVPADSVASSDQEQLGTEFEERESLSPYNSSDMGAHCSCESVDSLTIPCQEKFDYFSSSVSPMRRPLANTTSDELSFDFTKIHDYDGLRYPEEAGFCDNRVNHVIENSFTNQLSYSEVFPGSPDSVSSCFFTTVDGLPCDGRSEKNWNSFIGLSLGKFKISKLVDGLENSVRDSSRKSLSTMNCKDDELCFSPGRIVYQKHPSYKIILENDQHDEISDTWLDFNFSVADNTSNHKKHADDLHIQKNTGGAQREEFQYCRFSHSTNLRSRRSHSAPPFYKRKSRFSTIYDYFKIAELKGQQDQYPNDAGTVFMLKGPSQPCGISQPSAKSAFRDPSSEILERIFVDEKNCEHEINIVQTNVGSEEDAPQMEYPIVNAMKWRCADLHPMVVQGSARSHNFLGYEDDVLDISSGLLHLGGSSLVPETISRDSLKDAKVLLQIDRKFIPVVAGGILVAIDQHAADERIRVEELRQKVMSGEGCTITYLDLEQELMLPEIGFQLIQNFGEQIKKWGWICSAHIQCSGSFAKNLNLLKKQSCSIKLLAVPCILGINLCNKDLLEYLEQLVDTDGTSTMPRSVLRVLNFKACRGAIMFGDPLLPSECSLIVEELKQTSLCFQCAHGRPTTAPLVNMVRLHEHLANMEVVHAESRSNLWHGLQQHRPSVERARVRLNNAKTFQNG